jgi:hypothetical protein
MQIEFDKPFPETDLARISRLALMFLVLHALS